MMQQSYDDGHSGHQHDNPKQRPSHDAEHVGDCDCRCHGTLASLVFAAGVGHVCVYTGQRSLCIARLHCRRYTIPQVSEEWRFSAVYFPNPRTDLV